MVQQQIANGEHKDDDTNDVMCSMDQILNSGCYDQDSIGQYRSGSRLLEECRRSFKGEVIRLKEEVDTFRADCDAMIEADKQRVEEHKSSYDKQLKKLLKEYEHKKEAIIKPTPQHTDSSNQLLERKESCLQAERLLIEREEGLLKEQQRLEDYDKELEEIERNLHRRERMCANQSTNLISLQDEINQLREELETSKSNLPNAHSHDPKNNNARYSDIIERDLRDRHHTLENTLAKYRSELAHAEAKSTIKDININKLIAQISQQEEELEKRNTRIHQLESRLVMALSELRSELVQKKNSSRKMSTASTASASSVNNSSKTQLKRRHTVTNMLSSIRNRKKTFDSMDSVDESYVTYPGPQTSSTVSFYDTSSTLHESMSKSGSPTAGSGVCLIM